MDMGIKGKTALICGSSKGLGRGCAEALAAEGVNLVMNARTSSILERTAEKIRKTYRLRKRVFGKKKFPRENYVQFIQTILSRP